MDNNFFTISSTLLHLFSIGSFVLSYAPKLFHPSSHDQSTQTPATGGSYIPFFEEIDDDDEEEEVLFTSKADFRKYRFHYRFDKRDERDLWIHFDPVPEGQQSCCEILPHASLTVKSLRNFFPAVYDQGELGSCTANAVCGVFQFDEMMRYGIRLRKMNPSRLFLYYNERALHHNENEDSGASLRDGIKCASRDGICLENSWPYDIQHFTEKPPAHCYEEAKEQKAIKYYAVRSDEKQLEQCIDHDYAIVFGMVIFESFLKTTEDGLIPLPEFSKEKILGGHALVITGYDAENRKFEIRNSWGTQWGRQGYGYIDYEYILDRRYASDFWCLQKVENDYILPHRPLFSERSSITISSYSVV